MRRSTGVRAWGGGGGPQPSTTAASGPQWKGLTRDSKVNPDVLLLLISLADEWEGKITGASQGGPARCPATQALPWLTSAAPAADRAEADCRGVGEEGEWLSEGLHVVSACR